MFCFEARDASISFEVTASWIILHGYSVTFRHSGSKGSLRPRFWRFDASSAPHALGGKLLL